MVPSLQGYMQAAEEEEEEKEEEKKEEEEEKGVPLYGPRWP